MTAQVGQGRLGRSSPTVIAELDCLEPAIHPFGAFRVLIEGDGPAGPHPRVTDGGSALMLRSRALSVFTRVFDALWRGVSKHEGIGAPHPSRRRLCRLLRMRRPGRANGAAQLGRYRRGSRWRASAITRVTA